MDEERSIRVPVNCLAGVLGDFTGRVIEALLAAVCQAAEGADLTMIEAQVRLLEPSLMSSDAATLTARCLRRGANIVFARGEVTNSDGRHIALATATFARAA